MTLLLGGLGRRSLELLAFCLCLDQLLDLFGVSVPVFFQLEFSGHSRDQLSG